MRTYEMRLDDVVLAVWERWTKNGLNLDEDEREQTIKSVRDAATNAYIDDMDDATWCDATLARLTN